MEINSSKIKTKLLSYKLYSLSSAAMDVVIPPKASYIYINIDARVVKPPVHLL